MGYERLTDRVGWIPGGVNTGVIRLDDGHVAVIDPGLNETSGKRVIRTVRDELGSEIVAIVTTHGHADHFGANAAVVKRTGARVYAPAVEEFVLRFPVLSPAMLYGGADPVDALRTGFLLAEASSVDVVIDGASFEVAGVEVDVVPLWGHSVRQVGYLVEGVLFSADVLLPETALVKYPVPYVFGMKDHLASMASLGTLTFDVSVPGHGSMMEDVSERLAANRGAAERVLGAVLEAAREPAGLGEVMARVIEATGATVADAPAYFLVQPTVAACLSHLEREGELELVVGEGRARWVRQ